MTTVVAGSPVRSQVVGESGLLADQDSGTLAIEGIGTATVPRDLGDVFVLVGNLDLNDVFVDGNFIRIGSSNQTQFTDPSAGTMSVMLSAVASMVTVRNGSLGCQASRMEAPDASFVTSVRR